MSDAELTKLVRETVDAIDKGGPEGVDAKVKALRAAPGISPNVHVGADPDKFTPRMTLEWYAGSILDIVDKQAWFAMNSIINCKDKFAPEVAR